MSSRKPTTTGWLRSRVKYTIFCSLPSSKILKSLRSRLETKRSFSSVTVTGTITSLTWMRRVGGCSCPAGAGAGSCATSKETSINARRTRKAMGPYSIIAEEAESSRSAEAGCVIHWSMSDTRQRAHQLLDQLDPSQFAAVVHLLEIMVPPEEDRDTLSPTEAKAVAEADEWSKHNEAIPHEQMLAEFGLTLADWEKMSREP